MKKQFLLLAILIVGTTLLTLGGLDLYIKISGTIKLAQIMPKDNLFYLFDVGFILVGIIIDILVSFAAIEKSE